jgi:riboflavin biosynthesis pyrimidine reductase
MVMRRLLPPGGAVELDIAYAYRVDDAGGATVRANMVSTVDGAASGSDGLSGTVSGEADRRVFRTLRQLADVVLVGAGTARAEDYRPAALPIAVVSGRLDLDLTAPLYAAAEHKTIVITCRSAPADRLEQVRASADVLVCGDDRIDLASAVDALNARGLGRILCEGGPTLLAQIAAAGLLDELCLTTAPFLAGAGAGRILAGDPLVSELELSLVGLLEEDGWLFARYCARP